MLRTGIIVILLTVLGSHGNAGLRDRAACLVGQLRKAGKLLVRSEQEAVRSELANRKIRIDWGGRYLRLRLGAKVGETRFDTSYVIREVMDGELTVSGGRISGMDGVIRIPKSRAAFGRSRELAQRFRRARASAYWLPPQSEAPWLAGEYPAIPMVGFWEDRAWGPLIVQPWVDGWSFRELAEKHGRNLPDEMRQGLTDLRARIAALQALPKGRRLDPLDLSPDNLIWVTGLAGQVKTGLRRPGFVLKELRSPPRGWNPTNEKRYLARIERFLEENRRPNPLIPWDRPDRYKRRLAVSAGAVAAVYGAAGLAIQRSEKAKARAKRLAELSALPVHTEAELVELARLRLDEYRRTGQSSGDLGAFLVESELIREHGPEKARELLPEYLLRLEEARAKLREAMAKESGCPAKIEAARKLLFAGPLRGYYRERDTMTSLLEGRPSNCVGRTKLVLGLLADSEIARCDGKRLAYQDWLDHLEPVQLDPKTRTLDEWVFSSRWDKLPAPVFAPEELYARFLADQGIAADGGTLLAPSDPKAVRENLLEWEKKNGERAPTRARGRMDRLRARFDQTRAGYRLFDPDVPLFGRDAFSPFGGAPVMTSGSSGSGGDSSEKPLKAEFDPDWPESIETPDRFRCTGRRILMRNEADARAFNELTDWGARSMLLSEWAWAGAAEMERSEAYQAAMRTLAFRVDPLRPRGSAFPESQAWKDAIDAGIDLANYATDMRVCGWLTRGFAPWDLDAFGEDLESSPRAFARLYRAYDELRKAASEKPGDWIEAIDAAEPEVALDWVKALRAFEGSERSYGQTSSAFFAFLDDPSKVRLRSSEEAPPPATLKGRWLYFCSGGQGPCDLPVLEDEQEGSQREGQGAQRGEASKSAGADGSGLAASATSGSRRPEAPLSLDMTRFSTLRFHYSEDYDCRSPQWGRDLINEMRRADAERSWAMYRAVGTCLQDSPPFSGFAESLRDPDTARRVGRVEWLECRFSRRNDPDFALRVPTFWRDAIAEHYGSSTRLLSCRPVDGGPVAAPTP